jgi:hypothetical protein
MVDTTLENASIPKELIMNRDDTVPRATTSSKKGSKKVRVIGMGVDKAQCTTLYVPAAKTDMILECDIVINQVFKNRIREARDIRDK